jgi:hypothetical protein
VTGGVFGRAAWGSEPYFDAVQARGEDGARRSMGTMFVSTTWRSYSRQEGGRDDSGNLI